MLTRKFMFVQIKYYFVFSPSLGQYVMSPKNALQSDMHLCYE